MRTWTIGFLAGATLAVSAEEVETFATGKRPEVEVHVSTRGDDGSGDGSEASPFRTIERGVLEAKGGTAVRVHPGVYRGGVCIENLAGTAEEPIWIGGIPGKERPVIEGGGEALHLSKVRYLVVHNLEVRKMRNNGINCDDGGAYADPEATRHVVFRDLFIHDIGGTGNQDGLKLSGVDDFFVVGCEFARCGGGSSGSGIDHVGCHHGEIVNNYLHDISGNGVQCKGGSTDIEIRANRFVDFGHRSVNIGGSTGLEYFRPPVARNGPNAEATDIRVIANVIEGGVASICFVGCVECVVSHNTVVNPGRWLVRILQETKSTGEHVFFPCSHNEVSNNIFYFARGKLSTYLNIGAHTLPKTFTFCNNLWFAHDDPAQSGPTLPVEESGAVTGKDPRFRVGKGHDYRLEAGSPAIGAGKVVGRGTLDYSGKAFRNPPSIGAFEGTSR